MQRWNQATIADVTPRCRRSTAVAILWAALCLLPVRCFVSSLHVPTPLRSCRIGQSLTKVHAVDATPLQENDILIGIEPKKKARLQRVRKNISSDDGASNEVETEVKKKKRKAPSGPLYWRGENDGISWEANSGHVLNMTEAALVSETRKIRFQIRGNPRPLRRHRTAKGFMYNPSALYQETFRKVVHQMIWPHLANEADNHVPLFVEEDQLLMNIVFHMKRPKNHFVAGRPGPGRLRAAAPPKLAPSRTDVDNLAKFVLDSLNGLLYVDDRQVSSIRATRVFDNDGDCEGSTEVCIQRLTQDDMDQLLGDHFYFS